jgi:hypothetical protein
MEHKDLCITTYVFGNKYQQFIPLYLYSIMRAYPEYEAIVFIDDKLDENVKRQINTLEAGRTFRIVEGCQDRFGRLSGQPAASVRWILYDKQFEDYESIYIGDIDFFICQESLPLFEQHTTHCDVTGLFYSNALRYPVNHESRDLRSIAARITRDLSVANLRAIMFPPKNTYRLSGLHFVRTKEYFDAVRHLLPKYKKLIQSTSMRRVYLKHHRGGFNDECLLYDLVQEAGLGLPEKFLFVRGKLGSSKCTHERYK